jgi:hypothetical protein
METESKLCPKETLKEMYLRIHPQHPQTNIVETYHHGKDEQSCFICNAEIDEFITGKLVQYRQDGIKHTDTICINCFVEPEYWEGKEIIQVTNF